MSTIERNEHQQQEKIMEVSKNIIINAPPEVVFEAITDPQQLIRWFPDQAILEPKVGGKMKFTYYKNSERGKDCGRERDKFHEGTVTEFIPNKKIFYTWENSDEPDFPRTVVTWELEKVENNKTSLKLVHTGFNADEKAKKYNEGWSYLNELVKFFGENKVAEVHLFL